MKKELRFNDDVIANVAKILQIAILTGTDIVDNLRMVRLSESEDGILAIHENFKNNLDSNIEKLLSQVEEIRNSEEHQE
tara:strand:- start:1783 stop:2019 length:237 start_codon:yes stop_codon:yes gene_type:complete